MKRCLFPCLALALTFGQAALGQEKKIVSFSALEAASADTVKTQAAAWLKEVGKTDAASVKNFDALWGRDDRAVLDRLADTFTFASPAAAKLLQEARDETAPAPIKVPELLQDAKQSPFFRANLGLAYARALSNRRVYEESLDALKLIQPEQVVSPSAYLFHRAVCEHAVLQKEEARRSIDRLLEDAVDSPERYKTLAGLMLLDMAAWKTKDLGAIARKMENIERRLELARGGPQTQKLQKEVIARLDELIKEMENKAKQQQQGQGQGQGGQKPQGCPDGGQPGQGNQPGNKGGDNPSSPMQDSNIATNGGDGVVNTAKLKKLVEGWGRMQPREQARALQELTQGMSPRHREAIENYFRNLARK